MRQAGGNPCRIPDPRRRAVAQARLRAADPVSSDRGVVCLLDTRIVKQRYGRIFFDSLPDYTFSTVREDVERFFAEAARPPVRAHSRA
ncbi:MAG: hypothetical protein R2724_18445 [Bryobacterales bacterium]